MLGGIQYEAPELADHLMAGRFVSFFKSALDWAVARQKPIYSLFADALVLAASRYRPDLLRSETGKPFAWALLGAPKRDRVFHEFSDWWRLSPTPLLMESVRFVLAQQLTSTDPPLTGCLEKRYPYLDRQLFEFLASIPRSQVLRAGHRRYLMRRALRGLVPDEVLLRKTKWFGYRSPAAVLNAAQEGLEAVFKEPWLTDELVVNTKLVWEHLQSVQHGRSDEAIALRSAIAVEQWLRVQVRSGIFDGEFRASGRTPAFESAATSA
jgi:asparagine synthase (glutamine-hydrolysing)